MRVSGHSRTALEQWEVGLGDRWIPARVPGTFAGALRAAGEWSFDTARDFDKEEVTFRTVVPAEAAGAVLGFDGVATTWEAFLDGTSLAKSDSMWARREVAIPHGGELTIKCGALATELAKKRPRPRWKVPMLQQQQLRWIRTTLLGRTPGWSPNCPAIGPWRPVWFEHRVHRVGEVRVIPRVDGERGIVQVVADLPDATDVTVVIARDNVRVIAPLVREGDRWHGTAIVDHCERWWPHTHGTPARYDVMLDVREGDRSYEIREHSIGFRELVVEGDYTIRVNGKHVFARGACWTPLDVVDLRSSAAEYDAAIAQLARGGMNMIRVGGTMVYEDDAFYNALDRHGVLLWQDLMFANMDYPDDPDFVGHVRAEVDGEVLRLAARPSLAIVCGSSEAEQQAAMFGAGREKWEQPLFHTVLREVVAARSDVAYVPSSATGGAFPHTSNIGPSSYYGVGAYMRPLEDARRAEVVFASECLGFSNLSADGEATRVPKDLGASWDFADIREFYTKLLVGGDAELGRVITGEVMARTFAEWRRAKSVTRGGLMWFLRDLWPSAGWGVIDSSGQPKPAWYVLRRALQSSALAFSDEGTNGLVLHGFCERDPIEGTLEVALWRDSNSVGRASRSVRIEPGDRFEIEASELFEGWYDLSYAYRFGPPTCDVVHARLGELEAFYFPAGIPVARDPDVGLQATRDGDDLVISAKRFARFVRIDGGSPDDNFFHLAPGQERRIRCLGDATVRLT
ncbi:MAG: hypothetical protein QM831_06610 [Kofleriaceae bacterium]